MGCRVCRARKVKCDGRPNGCRNCERLQLDCVDDSSSTPIASITGESPALSNAQTPSSAHRQSQGSDRLSPVSLRRIRTYRSCTTCRLSKTKCNGDRPKCSRCTAKDVECVYDGGSAPRWTRSLGSANSAVTEGTGTETNGTGTTDGQSSMEDDADDGETTMADDGPRPGDAAPVSRPESVRAGPAPQLEPMDTEMSGMPSQDKPQPKDQPYELSESDPWHWLLASELPQRRQLRRVVEQYFSNVHPIRCFAFVHKPSFIRQLEKGFTTDEESALLHVICALGAKFLVLSSGPVGEQYGPGLLRAAGNQWAQKAETLMLANFGKISIQRLMTAVLLHDFRFRRGEYATALMLSGLTIRMAHALKINTEYNSDVLCTEATESEPTIVGREARRRLMWACYVLDAWTGSGVEQLTLLRENDIKIQLPCNERNFGLRIACVTETLGVGHVLQFLHPAVVPRRPAGNMGIMAYYIRIVALWKKVVKYVTHSDTKTPPWQPESDFAALISDLHLWRRELPEFVEYSTDTIYARLDSNQLGALVLIHCTYHHNYLELHKLSMPDLFKLRKPFVFPPEQTEFLQSVQADCYHHALEIANIVDEAAEHGARLLSDSLLPFFVYDSSRVMLYYVARLLNPNRVDAQHKLREAIKAVEGNNRVLRMMAPLFPISDSLSATIERWLFKIRRTFNRDGSTLDPNLDLSPILASRATPDPTLPPLHHHNVARAEKRAANGRPTHSAGRPSAEHPNASSSSAQWDHNSAAQQLVGLSQEPPRAAAGLQHERPVPPQPLPRLSTGLGIAGQGDNGESSGGMFTQGAMEALDLDDLQNFLSWDMYGIMDVSDMASNNGTEVTGQHSWSG